MPKKVGEGWDDSLTDCNASWRADGRPFDQDSQRYSSVLSYFAVVNKVTQNLLAASGLCLGKVISLVDYL